MTKLIKKKKWLRTDTAAEILGMTTNNIRQLIFKGFIRRTTWNNGGSKAKIHNYVLATDVLYIKSIIKNHKQWWKQWQIPEARKYTRLPESKS